MGKLFPIDVLVVRFQVGGGGHYNILDSILLQNDA